MNIENLTPQEEEAMLLIWETGSFFIKDILKRYEEPRPPYTTLASIVKNLERKKYLKAKQYGNTYEYTPIIKEKDYKRVFMNKVINNYYKNSYKEMVSFFAKEQKISAEELKEIVEMIENGK